MKALLHSLLEAATLGRPVVLCTVVHSGGSAPRSAGAHMAVFADGSTRGTVGGVAYWRAACRKRGAGAPAAAGLGPAGL